MGEEKDRNERTDISQTLRRSLLRIFHTESYCCPIVWKTCKDSYIIECTASTQESLYKIHWTIERNESVGQSWVLRGFSGLWNCRVDSLLVVCTKLIISYDRFTSVCLEQYVQMLRRCLFLQQNWILLQLTELNYVRNNNCLDCILVILGLGISIVKALADQGIKVGF